MHEETHIDTGKAAPGGRRWLTRSSVVAGGLASLAAGALLGGILEGVHALMPAADGHGPTLARTTDASAPWRLADAVLPGGPLPLASSVPAAAAAQTVLGEPGQPLTAPTTAVAPGATTGGSLPVLPPSPAGTGSASSATVTGPVTGGGSGSGGCALCVDGTPPSLPVGSVPVVGPALGPVVSTVTQAATGAASTVLDTVSGATAPVTGAVGAATGTSSSSGSGATVPVAGLGSVTVGGDGSGTSVTAGPVSVSLG